MTKTTTKTRKTKKTRRKIGSLLLGLLLSCIAAQAQKPKSAAAMLGGTVFRDNGFALRGAEAVVRAAAPSRGKSEWKAVSDARGEFYLRLPPGPASYTVTVKAKGFRTQEKTVTYAADERYDLTFLLEAELPEKK
jgi:hypothetical protein